MTVCNSCKFYDEPNAECRFNAPLPDRSAEEARWPGVNPDDWCGRHEEGEAGGQNLQTKYDHAIQVGTELWMAAHAVRDTDSRAEANPADFEKLREVLKKTGNTFDDIPF